MMTEGSCRMCAVPARIRDREETVRPQLDRVRLGSRERERREVRDAERISRVVKVVRPDLGVNLCQRRSQPGCPSTAFQTWTYGLLRRG